MTTGRVTALVRVNTTANRNSVQAKMKAKIPLAISPGSASGSVILARSPKASGTVDHCALFDFDRHAGKYERIIQITKGRLKTA